jgi:signal transduction histidine kinase
MNRTRSRRFRDLPLFWKLLLPLVGLVFLMGSVGTLVVVRDLSGRAQVTIDRELSLRSLDARTALHDRELYLLEAVNFASNVQGMVRALQERDRDGATSLLESVLALKNELDVLVVADAKGRGVAEFVLPASPPEASSGKVWNRPPFVVAALKSSDGARSSGLMQIDGKQILAVAGPVCSTPKACKPAGVVISGMDLGDLVAEALARSSEDSNPAPSAGVAVFGSDGKVIAQAGLAVDAVPPKAGSLQGRASVSVARDDIETLYAPFEVGGASPGTIAVSVTRSFAFASVRGAGIRLALVVLGTMIGVTALGALLSRLILVQVRPLLEANRAFERGDLSARVPVKSSDELGELARGVNQMAQQLQASYETLEARVDQRTKQVQQLLEQRSEFFASLSHELRTPLAIILSEAVLLEEPGQRLGVRQIRDAAGALRVSGEQILSIVNEILEFAKAEAGELDLELEDIGLTELIDGLQPAIAGLAKAGDLTLEVNLPTPAPTVVADRWHLREVILNLVDNAVKYTPAGGTVEITAASQNGHVDLSIADSGIGISPEVGKRIFEPFFRVKDVRPFRGQVSSGLGLALSKRFVEAQGGGIDFASRTGGGSIFTVTLPSAALDASEDRAD